MRAATCGLTDELTALAAGVRADRPFSAEGPPPVPPAACCSALMWRSVWSRRIAASGGGSSLGSPPTTEVLRGRPPGASAEIGSGATPAS
eukprot:scaffold118132_cov57-Phaeocystis_antarctica.AAC.1